MIPEPATTASAAPLSRPPGPGVFEACGLPDAWAGRPCWRILDTHFGDGCNFLRAWQAWSDDTARCGLLHVVALMPQPLAPDALPRPENHPPELAARIHELAEQFTGLLPGFHRLAFDGGRVLLTLCIGDRSAMLRAQRFDADSVFLSSDADSDAAQLARLARPGTGIAGHGVSAACQVELLRRGYRPIQPALDGPALGHDLFAARFDPPWVRRRRNDRPAGELAAGAGRCAVVGAGLAGAAVAASLARRGWQVTVLDAAPSPAAGASAVPVGLFAPHVSRDDAVLSQLTRAGVRALRSALRALPVVPIDDEPAGWRADGVIERRADDAMRLPEGWSDQGPNLSRRATPADLASAGLPPDTPALRHDDAGWVRPDRVIRAWLAIPGVHFVGGRAIDRIDWVDGAWRLRDVAGHVVAEADRVVIAAGSGSGRLAPALPLHVVRGQLSWGRMDDISAPIDKDALPRLPVNGDGHLIAHVPHPQGALWVSGATFDRGRTDTASDDPGTRSNAERLARLHPAAARALLGAFDAGRVQAWAGIRCTSSDRRPLVGPVDPDAAPGLWVCTALGSRGLSFAALCAELLAARWHAEPLP
ncbi:MAG: FAD-dependent oxidoreductase, partial [Comamonadaceae bacterium]